MKKLAERKLPAPDGIKGRKKTKSIVYAIGKSAIRGMAGLTLALALSIGAAGITKAQPLPPARHHEITFGFSKHATASDAGHFSKTITEAKKQGRPYHALGFESSRMPRGEMEKTLEGLKLERENDEEKFSKLLAAGFRENDALEKMRQEKLERARKNGDPHAEYTAELATLAFRHKLPLVPIEEYSESEVKQLGARWKAMEKHYLEGLAAQSMHDQLGPFENAEREISAYAKQRNDRIRETIPKAMELLRKHHPEIGGGGTLRVLYTVGEAHAGLASPKGNPSGRQAPSPQRWDYLPLELRLKLSNDPGAHLTREERARIVLAKNIYLHWPDLEEKGANETVERLRSKVSQATLREFEELDEKTRAKTPLQRAEIIRKFMTKQNP